MPFCNNIINYSPQILYSADKLQDMVGKQITGLTFKYYNEYPGDYVTTPKFYLSEVDANEFKYNDAVSMYEWFPFDQTAKPNGEAKFELDINAFYSTAEYTVKLTTPYTYNGKGLMLTVVNNNDVYTEQSMGYFAFHSFYDSWKNEANKIRYKRIALWASDEKGFLTNLGEDEYLNIDGYERIDMELPVIRFEYNTDNGGVSETDAAATSIIGATGAVRVTTATATTATGVEIYNIAGQQVANEIVAAGTREFTLPAGLYIVKTANATAKVVVK